MASKQALFVSLGLFLIVPAAAFCSLAVTQTGPPDLGVIVSGDSGRQFILNTDGTISGTHSGDYVSGATAGSFTIEDTSSPATLNIAVMIVGTFGGLEVNEALCSYNGSAQQTCSGSGMSVVSSGTGTLRLGLDVTTSAVHRGGDVASATLELTVSYL